jgi:hypothetical protein
MNGETTMNQTDLKKTAVELFRPTIPLGLLADYRAAENELHANSGEISKLAAKIDGLSASIPGLVELVNHTSRLKSDVLASHAVDLSTAEDLATARKNYEEAVKAVADAQELLTAVEKAMNQAESKISVIQSRKLHAEKKIWREYHNQLLTEITKVAGGLFVQADVAARQLGADYQGNPFVGIHPSHVKGEALRLKAEIFGTDR